MNQRIADPDLHTFTGTARLRSGKLLDIGGGQPYSCQVGCESQPLPQHTPRQSESTTVCRRRIAGREL